MATIRWIACLSMSLLLGLSTASAQEKKPLAVEDLYLMESVRSPALFAKEEKLVYERVWIDAKTKLERHSLWLVTGNRENRKPLEKDEPDGRSPVVSPDGQWIAFLSTRPTGFGSPRPPPPVPPYSDTAVGIRLYSVKTGYSVPLIEGPTGLGRVFHDGFYGRVAFSPDSKKLAFIADDGVDPRTKEEIDNDVEIVRPDQGEGYTGYGAAQVWIATIEPSGTRKVTRLTNDDIWYGDPQWSPDGKSLVVVANKSKDCESVRFNINKNFDLYLIDVATKKQTQLTTNPGPDVSPRWSPDGKQIAYLSSPRKGPHRDVLNLTMLTFSDGRSVAKPLFDHHDGKLGKPLHPSPFFPLFNDCWDTDGYFWYYGDTGIGSRLTQIHIATGKDILGGWADDDPGTRYLESERRRGRLPSTNSKLGDRYVSQPDVVKWRNEGLEIDGVLTLPPPDVAKPPYKLIVYPHGGPHGQVYWGLFDFTVQLFAAHGYAVFQPNFRGSTGYGKKFLDADRFDLGGGDMRDILTGIDKLVKDGTVDPKRQFVYGISYGGFMASWLVGQTHQFRAAVAQNAVTDMNMMYGLSDLQSWTTWELGGTPWEQPERYRKMSPLTYADKVKTPTLILHARDDRRCPLPMGKAFHQALLANEVPTQMVIYPNEGHGIKSPRHREDVYRRVLAWFAKYDK
ncbi:MAG: S9 family peptidase [Gemmataceae bacterium]|nr:S9 family peptidase [Gemmataceae bacterium]